MTRKHIDESKDHGQTRHGSQGKNVGAFLPLAGTKKRKTDPDTGTPGAGIDKGRVKSGNKNRPPTKK